jgi:hypothetical protein
MVLVLIELSNCNQSMHGHSCKHTIIVYRGNSGYPIIGSLWWALINCLPYMQLSVACPDININADQGIIFRQYVLKMHYIVNGLVNPWKLRVQYLGVYLSLPMCHGAI